MLKNKKHNILLKKVVKWIIFSLLLIIYIDKSVCAKGEIVYSSIETYSPDKRIQKIYDDDEAILLQVNSEDKYYVERKGKTVNISHIFDKNVEFPSYISYDREGFTGTLYSKSIKTIDSNDFIIEYEGRVFRYEYIYYWVHEYKGIKIKKNDKLFNLGKGNLNTRYINNSVNIITGNFYYKKIDLIDEELFIPISRTYNSLDNTIGIMGKGWRFSFESFIEVEESTGNITVDYPDGHSIVFQKNDDGKYSSPKSVSDELIKTLDNRYILKSKTNKNYYYNSDGKLMQIKDEINNVINLTYDSNSNLKKITSSNGKEVIIIIENDKIKSIVDTSGRLVEYKYDNDHQLTEVKTNKNKKIYTYNKYGIVTEEDINGKKYLENKYDKFGRIIWQEDFNGKTYVYEYNEATLENTVIFQNDKNITYKYNLDFYITKIDFDDKTHESYTYNDKGYLLNKTNNEGKALLPTPTGFEVNAYKDSIIISWNELDSKIKYELEIDGNIIDNEFNTSYIHNNLKNGSQHVYRVRAKLNDEVSEWSRQINEQITSPINLEDFNLMLINSNIEDFSRVIFRIEYNYEQLELLDLCSMTQEKEIRTGIIEGTNINITQNKLGLIIFTIDKDIAENKKWSGVINCIKFKEKTPNGKSSIRYTIN